MSEYDQQQLSSQQGMYSLMDFLTNEEDRVNAYADDTKVKELIEQTFPELLPLHSRVNSLTYVEKDEAQAIKYGINTIVGLVEMTSDMKEYNSRVYTLLESLAIHLKLRVNDSLKGRKLKALTQHTRIIQMMQEQAGRRWFR